MKAEHKRSILNRLKTARGHLDAVVRMVDDDAYCPEVMKQLSAVQGSLERASRLVLRNHLETCVASAMREGRVDEIVDELMETLRYDRISTGPERPSGAGDSDSAPTGPDSARAGGRLTNVTRHSARSGDGTEGGSEGSTGPERELAGEGMS